MGRRIDGDHLVTWILNEWIRLAPDSEYPLKASDILDQIYREMAYPPLHDPSLRCKDCGRSAVCKQSKGPDDYCAWGLRRWEDG